VPDDWVDRWGSLYGPKVDVWAVGVVLYIAIMGECPFIKPTADQLMRHTCDPDTVPSFVPKVGVVGPRVGTVSKYKASQRCVDCLSQLLEKDQDLRPTAAEACSDPWFQNAKRIGGKVTRGVCIVVRSGAGDPVGGVQLPLDIRRNALLEVQRIGSQHVTLETERSRYQAFVRMRAEAESRKLLRSPPSSFRIDGLSARSRTRRTRGLGRDVMFQDPDHPLLSNDGFTSSQISFGNSSSGQIEMEDPDGMLSDRHVLCQC